MRWACWSAALVVILACGRSAPARDDDGNTAAALKAAKAAVAEKDVKKTRLLGFTLNKEEFTRVREDGGILIGLDVGVGLGAFKNEVVYAVKPIFRTKDGSIVGPEIGVFESGRVGNRYVRTRVANTVTLMAKKGYAVSGLTVRSGLGLVAVKLTFARVAGDRLDLTDTYESEWAGNRFDGGKGEVTSDGRLVVGLCGAEDPDVCLALGLIHLNKPELKPVPKAVVKPAPPMTPVKPRKPKKPSA